MEQRRLFAVGQGETITLEDFLERQRTTQQEVAQVRAKCVCVLRAYNNYLSSDQSGNNVIAPRSLIRYVSRVCIRHRIRSDVS